MTTNSKKLGSIEDEFSLVKLTPKEVFIRIILLLLIAFSACFSFAFLVVPWIYGVMKLLERFKIF